jgi:predicted small integral membrane protein
MRIIRLSKTAIVATIALFASVVAFGNVNYGTNWAFVQHVLSMDTVFPTTTIKYRAIDAPALQTAGYVLVIAAETLPASASSLPRRPPASFCSTCWRRGCC